MPADLRTPPAPPRPPLAVNDREAARMLGVCSRTLFDWRKNRRGPRFKREGSRILYAVAELERWLTTGDEPPATAVREGGGR